MADKNQSDLAKQVAIACNDIQYIKQDVAEIKTRLNDKFVTKDEFEPIKRIVYGMVALSLSAIFGTLINLILRK